MTDAQERPIQRTLVIMRHAKSEHADQPTDHERGLTAGGVADANAAGRVLRAAVGDVHEVLCSTAQRTQQTVAATGLHAPVRLERAIYLATPSVILQHVRATADPVRTLLVVGHAPGIPGLAGELATPDSDPATLAALHLQFPTSAVAVLAVDGPWSELAAGGGRLVGFFVPRG